MKYNNIFILLLALFALFTFVSCSDEQQNPPQNQTKTKQPQHATTSLQTLSKQQAIYKNNQGVGLMGQFDYAKAYQIFSELNQHYPDWLEIKLNLAIATLNRQQTGDEQQALALVDQLLQQHPKQIIANYLAGLLRLYLSSPQSALPHFQAVIAQDPKDAYAHYYLAQCLSQLNQKEKALAHYDIAIQGDPYLLSAYYGSFQILRQQKQIKRAKQRVQAYQKLRKNPQARLAEFKYTRMGPKAEAITVNQTHTTTPSLAQGRLFQTPIVISPINSPKRTPITLADVNHDGKLDIIANQTLLEQSNPKQFTRNTQTAWLNTDKVQAYLWGDFNNDGFVDVYLCRRGKNQLWQQTKDHQWQNITQSSQSSGGNYHTIDGMVVDADHDGDLDIFLVNTDGKNQLLNNNFDGSFTNIASQQGIDDDINSLDALSVDIDADRDLDLIVLNQSPPHHIYINNRLWNYQSSQDYQKLQQHTIQQAIAYDTDSNGYPELYTLDAKGQLQVWLLEQTNPSPKTLLTVEPSSQFGIYDINGNSQLEILLVSKQQWQVYSITQAKIIAKQTFDQAIQTWQMGIFYPQQGYSLMTLDHNNQLEIWHPGQARFNFLALNFSGRSDKAKAMRSNASGIGTKIDVRLGSQWLSSHTFAHNSLRGQSLQPLAIGLAGQKQADFIAINWSDGVFQTELNLQAQAKITTITETQRQLSSCPVLFAWNGKDYQFISDFLGVGGIGYNLGRGEYGQPRPWEYFLFPDNSIKPKHDRYIIKITEPMEEAAYIDAVFLHRYDLPQDWQMVLDERLGITDPQPTGKAWFYQQEWLPKKVINDRGQDVTKTLITKDGKASPVGKLDPRFIGRLQQRHQLILHFDQPINIALGQPILVIDGWVEYPYSQTMFSAWQAKANFQAPSIEVQDLSGNWHMLHQEFGYPAGMPRRMALALSNLPDNATNTFRLSTNMQIYWDRIAIAYAKTPPAFRQHSMPLIRAVLSQSGFPKWSINAQYRPHYDYNNRQPFWDTRQMAGYYTKIGLINKLVQHKDNALAIMGSGEEIELQFSAQKLPKNNQRHYFILETYGWAKDMDLFTHTGETLTPLPSTDKQLSQQAKKLHEKYNTRYQMGY